MSIFTKKIEKITYEDVEAFCCQKVKEGFKVEYKEDFPNKKNNWRFAGEIAAFANTYGGILLVGIEDDDGKPELPIKGIDYTEGISEKVVSICLDNINPPLIPSVHVCKIKDNKNKCVVIIRVEESDQTPHRVDNDRKVYIRADCKKEPTQAQYEQIEWLRNRKQKAVDNKERLLERARNRFTNYRPNKNLMPFREFYLIPCYPSKILFQLNEFKKVIDKTKFKYDGNLFPFDIHTEKSSSESLIFIYAKRKENIKHIHYFELNQYGLIFSKQNFFENLANTNNDIINILRILNQIILFLTYAKRFYNHIGYWGTLEIGHSMEGIQNKSLTTFSRNASPIDFGDLDDFGKSEFDNKFCSLNYINMEDLINIMDKLVCKIYKNFLWSCGAPSRANDDQKIKDDIKEARLELNINLEE